MYANGQTIIQFFEQLAPKYLAIEDDKIGLQVGSFNKVIKKVMLTLDVLEEVVDEAIKNEVDLIIAHHAVIFRPLKNLRTDLSQGRLLQKLLKHDISVYVAHTNLDVAHGGVNDVIAEKLGLSELEIIQPVYTDQLQEKTFGIGRIGKISTPISLNEFAQLVKKQLNVDGLRVVGDLSQTVSKIGVVGGDGNSFVSKAAFKGVDVLVTGDIYYHVAHDALAQNLSIIDAGHYIEKHVLTNVQDYLLNQLSQKYQDTEVFISKVNTNPFQFI